MIEGGKKKRHMGICPWGAFFSVARKRSIVGATFSTNETRSNPMNSTVKSYLYFLAFMALTKMVVKPVATQMNLPVIKDLL